MRMWIICCMSTIRRKIRYGQRYRRDSRGKKPAVFFLLDIYPYRVYDTGIGYMKTGGEPDGSGRKENGLLSGGKT